MNFDYGFITHGVKDKKKLVRLDSIEFEDGTDIYISLFQYNGTALNYYQKEGTLKGFRGEMYIDFLPFDIDAESIEEACKKQIRLIKDLKNKGITNYKISFSGKKGFHTIIDSGYFGGFEPSERLPEQLLALASQLTHADFDKAIYSNLRIFRMSNTKHNISGLYKIQIREELLFEPQKILELAKESSELFEIPEAMRDAKLTTLKEHCFSMVPKQYNFSNTSSVKKELCIESLFKGVGVGERHNALLVLTSHLQQKGLTEEVAWGAIVEWNKKNIERDIDEAFARTFKEVWKAGYTPGCWHWLKDEHCSKDCYLYKDKYTYGEDKKGLEFYSLVDEGKKAYIKLIENNEGIKLGLSEEIDNRMRYLAPGDLWGLMGRPACYKSTFAQMIGKYHVEHYDTLCVLISLEMGLTRLYERQWAVEHDISPQSIEEGAHNLTFDSKYNNFLFTVKKGLNLDQIRTGIQELEFQTGKKVGHFMIDFFHAIRAKGSSATEKAVHIMQGLKELPHQLNCVGGVLIHTSREGGGDGHIPLKLGSSRDSSAVEDNTDMLFGVFKPLDEENTVRLQFLKNKNGPTLEAGIPFIRSNHSAHLEPRSDEYLPTNEEE